MAGCKVSARSWKQRGPSMLARQDCCPGYITELCSRFQSQPVVLWQPGICPVHNLPVLISFSFALLLLPLCMCVCVCVSLSLSLLCKACAHVYCLPHTYLLPLWWSQTQGERERERAFSLGGIEFCKTGINQINYFYSCGCVCVVCLWRENDSFRACLLLFFSFLSYFFFLKKINLYNASTYLFSWARLRDYIFFFFFFFLFLQASTQHHESSSFWITESSKDFGQY